MSNWIQRGSLVLIAAALAAASVAATEAPAPPATRPANAQAAAAPAALSEEEKLAGFKLLFDGQTTNGWRQLGAKTFPAGWDVQDGALHHKANGGGGDITYDETLENFEIRFDFKIAPNGNSGVKYRVVEVPNNRSALGIEYQVVDAQSSSADNKGKHSIGSLYDLVDAKVATTKPAGEWNEARIIVKGNHFEHWLNGAKVAELDYGTDAWKTAFAASKWARTNPEFAANPKGNFILQDHTDEVWFRNIRMKVLKAD